MVKVECQMTNIETSLIEYLKLISQKMLEHLNTNQELLNLKKVKVVLKG